MNTAIIGKIQTLRNVPKSPDRGLVRHVAVILTSPRSGSSVVKSVLSAHPDIATMDGEIEPFLMLTKNGFGFNTDSDALQHCSNVEELASNLMDQLTLPSEEFPSFEWIKEQWKKRLLLHFPELFSEGKNFHNLLQSLDDGLSEIRTFGWRDEAKIQKHLLEKIFEVEPWRINFYDGFAGSAPLRNFNESCKIEEPPFVLPRLVRRPVTADDLGQKLLLFKTPPDVYRMGLYEQLFPNATIQYIYLTRGFAQTVNGLMDGWLSPVGFFSHDLGAKGLTLNIRGYSDRTPFGKHWWKFDLFPEWKKFVNAELSEVCLSQWSSAHRAILASAVPRFRVGFEQCLKEPTQTIRSLTSFLQLRPFDGSSTFPVVMATERPRLYRWKKREGLLRSMAAREDVRALMTELGMEMDPETWI